MPSVQTVSDLTVSDGGEGAGEEHDRKRKKTLMKE